MVAALFKDHYAKMQGIIEITLETEDKSLRLCSCAFKFVERWRFKCLSGSVSTIQTFSLSLNMTPVHTLEILSP